MSRSCRSFSLPVLPESTFALLPGKAGPALRRSAWGRRKAPGQRGPRSPGDAEGGWGLSRERAGVHGGPALPRGKGLLPRHCRPWCRNFRSPPFPSRAQDGPARLPESPASRSQYPRAALKFLHPAAPDSRPSSLGYSLSSPLYSPRPVKVWPQSPALTPRGPEPKRPVRASRRRAPHCGPRSAGCRLG